MNRQAIVTAALVVAVSGVAATATLTFDEDEPKVNPITDRTEQSRVGNDALALVGFPAARVGYEVRFDAGRAGTRAQVDTDAKEITVFLRRGDTPAIVAHDIAHEIGHAVDAERLDDAGRRTYLARRGVPGAEWLPGAASDYASGAGDFAEVFALCHAASADFRGTLAGRPENACELLPAEALR